MKYLDMTSLSSWELLLRFHFYAYHTWTDPTFSFDKPLMSYRHHYDIIPTYDIIFTSLLHYDLPMTSFLEHYKYSLIPTL